MNTMSDDDLQVHVLAILGMTDATKDTQDEAILHVRSIARKRLASYTFPTLPKAQAKEIQAIPDGPASAEMMTDLIVRMVPDSDARIRALMLEVAEEAGSIM